MREDIGDIVFVIGFESSQIRFNAVRFNFELA